MSVISPMKGVKLRKFDLDMSRNPKKGVYNASYERVEWESGKGTWPCIALSGDIICWKVCGGHSPAFERQNRLRCLFRLLRVFISCGLGARRLERRRAAVSGTPLRRRLSPPTHCGTRQRP